MVALCKGAYNDGWIKVMGVIIDMMSKNHKNKTIPLLDFSWKWQRTNLTNLSDLLQFQHRSLLKHVVWWKIVDYDKKIQSWFWTNNLRERAIRIILTPKLIDYKRNQT